MKAFRFSLINFLVGIIITVTVVILLGFTQNQEKKLTEYNIVTDENILGLTNKVKPYLENDYKLLGGVFVIYNNENSKHIFYQTVIR